MCTLIYSNSAVTTDCYTYAILSRLRCAHAARSALYRLAPAQTGEPWSPKPPRFGFQPSILKSASSASLLIAVQGIKWLLACNLRLPSHGLARPQHTGRGSRHSFNFHNTTIPRFDPGSAALRARRRRAFAPRRRARCLGQTVTLSGIGQTWLLGSSEHVRARER